MKRSSGSSLSFESRPLPRVFVLEVTRRCNNRCSYCYTAWNAPDLGYDVNKNEEMTTDEIKDVVAKLQHEAPVESIALSGGEPLIRADLPEIVKAISAGGSDAVIITNGTLLSEERVATTVADSTYEITLLSHRPETHDRLTRHPGSWNAVVDGMANVHKAQGSFVAAFIATKLNAGDLQKTVELAIALGAEGLMYNRMNLGAYNMRYADDLLPTPGMIAENLDSLDEIAGKYGFPIAASVVIEPCVVDTRKYKNIHFGSCPLAGPDSYFTIDPIGNVRVCNHSPVVLGSIRERSFSSIYFGGDSGRYLRSFHDTLPVECVGCDPDLLALCRGGCKAASEQCYGTIEKVDPFVRLNRFHTTGEV